MKCQKRLFLIGGPRFSGKDYVASRIIGLCAAAGGEAKFWSASGALKREYCLVAGLDINRMLTDREYKELHRVNMTAFFHKQIAKHGKDYYALKLVEQAEELSVSGATLVFDVRFRFEIECYAAAEGRVFSSVTCIRVQTSDKIRAKRGWVFDPAIDDDPSEKDLNGYKGWDFIITNDSDGPGQVDEQILRILL